MFAIVTQNKYKIESAFSFNTDMFNSTCSKKGKKTKDMLGNTVVMA